MESLQYFKVESGKKRPHGNILLFTDSEENYETLKLEVPESITLAIVAVGTPEGGPVPVRQKNHTFEEYKMYRGEKVISRLDEKWLKKISQLAPNFRYWLASSYTIPTEEILSFFRDFHEKKISKGLIRIRPVKSSYLLIPAMIFLSLSCCFSFFKTFRPLSSLILFFLSISVGAEEKKKMDEDLVRRHKEGISTREESLQFAQELLEREDYERASVIYEENIKKQKILLPKFL